MAVPGRPGRPESEVLSALRFRLDAAGLIGSFLCRGTGPTSGPPGPRPGRRKKAPPGEPPTTEDVSLRDANAVLRREGFRGVMRLDEVRKVDAIPVLGTGKTDYKVLRAQIG